MNIDKRDFTKNQLTEVCRNLGLEEAEVSRLSDLWDQKKETVRKNIMSLIELTDLRSRTVTNHESDGEASKEKYLLGYDSVQDLVFITDYPSVHFITAVPLDHFVTYRYEAVPVEKVENVTLPF